MAHVSTRTRESGDLIKVYREQRLSTRVQSAYQLQRPILSDFEKKEIIRKVGRHFAKDTWYAIDMECEVGLADELGVLIFTVKYQGKQCGSVKLMFSRERV